MTDKDTEAAIALLERRCREIEAEIPALTEKAQQTGDISEMIETVDVLMDLRRALERLRKEV